MDKDFLKEYKGRIVKYSFLPNKTPICTWACRHCYIHSSGSLKERIEKSEEQVLSEIKGLVDKGYTVIPLTTEMLMMSNWKDILRTVGEKKVYTNGIMMADNPSIVEDFNDEGILEVHVTGNVSEYHKNLHLAPSEKINKCISLSLEAGIKPVVTLLITSENYENLSKMIEYYFSRGVKDFNMIRVIGRQSYVMNDKQTQVFFDAFEHEKGKYGNAIRMRLDSSFGKYGDSPSECDGFFCGAGVDKVEIGYDNYIYPCSLLQYKEFRIGVFRDGKILLKNEFPFGKLNKKNCLSYQLINTRGVSDD